MCVLPGTLDIVYTNMLLLLVCVCVCVAGLVEERDVTAGTLTYC